MGKKVDLARQRFERLLVLKKTSVHGDSKWLCRCDCGKEVDVYGYNLKLGHTKSCGCLHREAMKRAGPMVGKKLRKPINTHYGRLRVICESNFRKYNLITYICLCRCSRTKTKLVSVIAMSLRSGNTKSCGCLQKEKARQNITCFNKKLRKRPTDMTSKEFTRLQHRRQSLDLSDVYIKQLLTKHNLSHRDITKEWVEIKRGLIQLHREFKKAEEVLNAST